MNLDSLKYVDLRRLAKEVGLKANTKADKLLKALKQHYEQQENCSENGNDIDMVDTHTSDVSQEQQMHNNNAMFVTKRRGKGQKTKRKHTEDADSDSKLSASPLQSDEKLAKPEEGKTSSKRRKIYLVQDSETPALPKESQAETEPEPNAKDGVTRACEKGGDKKVKRPVGKIPRHEGLLKRTKPTLKPTTPNFKKLHEAHFNKMESIDSYVQRKNKQMEVFRNSVKELQTLSEKTILKPMEGRSLAKSKPSRASLFSPSVQEKSAATDKRRVTQLSASKSALKNSTSFKPTILTTNKINVRFSEATQDNEHKRSLVKTPARMSPHVTRTSTPGRKRQVTKTAGIPKTPETAFIFNGNTSVSNTPGTSKNNAFDLKASLSRPLSYKPHKGKLKPFVENKENAALNKSQTIPSHQKNYKQHQVQTRAERRTKHTEGRKQKKDQMLGARRGLALT